MTTDPPARRVPAARPRAVPDHSDDSFADILSVLGRQLGEDIQEAEQKSRRPRRLKNVVFEYDHDPRTVHDMAGDAGYSLASNWFTQLLAQLAVANSITKSQMCVFLYVAGGQAKGTGIAQYTQQEITDGLNKLAVPKGGKCITRSTVNRAISSLKAMGWLEQAGHGLVQLNVRLWFNGNSTSQHEVLATLAREHGTGPEAFPNRVGPEQQALDLGLDAETGTTGRQERTG
ncbi:hypothetical protein [Streptomyces melanogenes]|uniref:hypothetical protein n=1 Tax=Streptomyces melanogenes TaxID=67326 RepID=UPI00167EE23B|nr:hypothetical protein [Streptomyces melanogenes]GGP80216.1 hypothetical protein GCM10010278_68340 [Streptomyces melanogenes]